MLDTPFWKKSTGLRIWEITGVREPGVRLVLPREESSMDPEKLKEARAEIRACWLEQQVEGVPYEEIGTDSFAGIALNMALHELLEEKYEPFQRLALDMATEGRAGDATGEDLNKAFLVACLDSTEGREAAVHWASVAMAHGKLEVEGGELVAECCSFQDSMFSQAKEVLSPQIQTILGEMLGETCSQVFDALVLNTASPPSMESLLTPIDKTRARVLDALVSGLVDHLPRAALLVPYNGEDIPMFVRRSLENLRVLGEGIILAWQQVLSLEGEPEELGQAIRRVLGREKSH